MRSLASPTSPQLPTAGILPSPPLRLIAEALASLADSMNARFNSLESLMRQGNLQCDDLKQTFTSTSTTDRGGSSFTLGDDVSRSESRRSKERREKRLRRKSAR